MISDADAHDLADLQRAYQQAQADTERARLSYYRTLIRIADTGGTHADLAAVLGVHRSRVGQLLDQARRAIAETR